MLPLLKMTPLMGEKVPASSFLPFFHLACERQTWNSLASRRSASLLRLPYGGGRIMSWGSQCGGTTLTISMWRGSPVKRHPSERCGTSECGGSHGSALGCGSNSCHRCPSWVTGGKLGRAKRWRSRQYKHATICQSNVQTSVGGRAWW